MGSTLQQLTYGRLSVFPPTPRYAGITVTMVIWRKYLCRYNQVTNLRVGSTCVKVGSGLDKRIEEKDFREKRSEELAIQ